ncbi:hypothetical protein DFH08DRAFT_853973 [Mycena albidolilacea]|uniref:Uncharacterized protein n=1 Tax=Mycena albidolilacea TaxID=1033008 RepID=A0AAD7ADU2_9AGAR|nr:hypothetical protein DFH08DRAFT_853973 [Mycena albidolilacea]
MMNRVNASTGFSDFQLRMSRSPPLVYVPATDAPEEKMAADIISRLELDLMEAQENLLAAKITQAEQANKNRAPEHNIQIGVVGRFEVLCTTRVQPGLQLRVANLARSKILTRIVDELFRESNCIEWVAEQALESGRAEQGSEHKTENEVLSKDFGWDVEPCDFVPHG